LFDLFLFNPRQMFHQRQIARMTGAHLHPIQNELAHLEEMQLVVKQRSGKNVYYSLNERNPICPILRDLIRRSNDMV
jgi:predicted transcriptional regulator